MGDSSMGGMGWEGIVELFFCIYHTLIIWVVYLLLWLDDTRVSTPQSHCYTGSGGCQGSSALLRRQAQIQRTPTVTGRAAHNPS